MMCARFSMRFLVLAALLSAPVLAYVPPDLLQRRTELVQLLPYADVRALQQWVETLPIELTPADYVARLRTQFASPSVAWTYYAACIYMERMERTQEAFEQRGKALDKARSLLIEYERRTTDSLRADYEPSNPPLELHLEQPDTQPRNASDNEGLTVFRKLPWPERYARADREKLLQASRDDIVRAEQQKEQLEGAQQAFIAKQDRFMIWLTELAEATRYFTTAQYLGPYGPDLPAPPGR